MLKDDTVKITECSREQEVIAAVVSHRWPERAGTLLRAHVASCDICRDVAEVAGAFGDDQDAAWQMVRVPSAAHMWWRLQMRARQDAARAALRPIAVVQGLVTVGIAGLAVAAIGLGWAAGSWSAWPLSTAASGFWPAASDLVGTVFSFADASAQATLVFGAIAAGLVLMPVAVYLALSE
jgi:hypothetical protein